MNPPPLIEAIDLAKTYPDGTCALRNASFTITSGEFVAIMGPSGSGKSTLLHILGFLDPQTSGEYRFRGRSALAIPQGEIARIRNEELGFVFQQFNLLPRETVLENVYMPLYYSTVPKREWLARATRAVEEVGLTHRMRHEAYMLSGGEKQRVAIARALIQDPKVIFADEPTGNLDTVAGNSVLELVERLHRNGHTVILITHDSDVAARAKRLLYVRDGVLEGGREVEL